MNGLGLTFFVLSLALGAVFRWLLELGSLSFLSRPRNHLIVDLGLLPGWGGEMPRVCRQSRGWAA